MREVKSYCTHLTKEMRKWMVAVFFPKEKLEGAKENKLMEGGGKKKPCELFKVT